MSENSSITRDEYCVVAIADAFRGDEDILVSPIGLMPKIGASLAKRTFSPDIMMTDGVASLVANPPVIGEDDPEYIVEGWMPYRRIFDLVWWGKRHVMMGATQIDAFGNQNISCIGAWEKPKVQLLGMRGAPGNTINHPTSYWIPKHTNRVFVEKVDVVSGIGYDRAAELGEKGSRFHEIRRVISNLGVFDFNGESRRMRVVSLHPGVRIEEVVENTGFRLEIPSEIPNTRKPSETELTLIRDQIDPSSFRKKEVPS